MTRREVCARDGCEEVVVQPKTGRRRRFHSPACRVAAWRDRQRLRNESRALDPLVSLAFSPEPWRTFLVGENGSSRLESVPWFEWWLVELGYDLRAGSPLEGAPLNRPRGPAKRKAAA